MTASIIDIHAHFYPRRYLELIAEEGAPFGASCALCAPDGPVVKVGMLFAGGDVEVCKGDICGVEVHAGARLRRVEFSGDVGSKSNARVPVRGASRFQQLRR